MPETPAASLATSTLPRRIISSLGNEARRFFWRTKLGVEENLLVGSLLGAVEIKASKNVLVAPGDSTDIRSARRYSRGMGSPEHDIEMMGSFIRRKRSERAERIAACLEEARRDF